MATEKKGIFKKPFSKLIVKTKILSVGLEFIAPVIVLKSSSGYRSILEGKYCVRIFFTK